jgi:CRISPR-associated protein Cmr5
MSHTLEQKRAKYALDEVIKFTGDKEKKEKYSTLVRRLPAMILNNGLGQALAFLLADDKGEQKEPSWQLYSQLQEWLCDKNHPPQIYSGKLIDSLMAGDRFQYIRAQQEVLTLLTWMTKFANAYLPKSGGS